MNLFWLDRDPILAAQAHQDVHVGKMLLEAVQLLCTAFPLPWESAPSGCIRGMERRYAGMSPSERLAVDVLPYTHTHTRHPCALWVRATRGNFDAAIALAQALAAEFTYRFDKAHASAAALEWVVKHRTQAQVPDGPRTPCALAMPAKYVPLICPNPAQTFVETVCVAAYRAYYAAEKRGYWRLDGTKWVPAKWTRREPPPWMIPALPVPPPTPPRGLK